VEFFARDLRLAARALARTPGFLGAAVVTLALGLGVTTAIFSVVNAILLRPVPGREPQRLVNVHRTAPDGTSFHGFSYPDLRDLRGGSGRVFSAVGAFTGRFVSLRREEGSELVAAQAVSGNYFEVLGVAPLLGRMFGPAEEEPGASAVLLSERLWRKSFGADPSIAGRSVTINGRPYTVTGVMPARFTGTFVGFTFDVWMPLVATATTEPGNALSSHERSWLELFARLAPGVTHEEAQASLSVLASALAREHPKAGKAWGVEVRPMTPVDDSLRRAVIRLFTLLLSVSALVLLIACDTGAAPHPARAPARRREIAIRRAIGAGQAALVRQLLAETAVLFGAGALGGLALAFLLSRLLAGFAPKFAVPLELDLSPDPFVLLVATLTAVATGVVFGLLPALRAGRIDVLAALKQGPAEPRPLLSRVRSLFVVGQIAASMLLLVAAGLLVQSVDNIRRTDPGFDATDVKMASLDVSLLSRDEARGEAFYRDLLAGAEAIPGVVSTALVRSVPLGGFGGESAYVEVDGFTPPAREGFEVVADTASPRSFETLRIPLVSGRDFRPTDGAGAPRVAVVNETFAERFWPGRSALGRRFRFAGSVVEVIGVAKAGKYRSLMEEPRLQVTLPLAQRYSPRMKLLLRTARGASVSGPFRQLLRALDPDLPVLDPMLLSDFIAVSFLPQRMAGSVTTALGLLGLVLASVGLYGIVAYTVGQRTREIGIRMALGARPAHVLSIVLRQTALLSGAGILAGLLAAAAVTRLLAGLLFGVHPTDPPALAGAALLLGAVMLAASLAPARRALAVDPALALRAE